MQMMKNSLVVLFMSALFLSHAQARSNALEREMKSYVRDLLKAHPEVYDGKKERDVREDMIRKATKAKLLELSKEEERRIRKHDPLVSDADFNKAFSDIKAMVKKSDVEINFLVAYAEEPKLKTVQKALAYRLSKGALKKLNIRSNSLRNDRMMAVMVRYTEYKDEHGKAPTTLADLKLAEENSQFINPVTGKKSNWIYIYHPTLRLKAQGSFLVLVEPESPNGTTLCGLDKGSVIGISEKKLRPQVDNVLKKLEEAKKNPAKKTQQPANAKSQKTIQSIVSKLQAYKNENDGSFPNDLSELTLAEDEKQYTNPENGEKTDWYYFGNSDQFRINKDKFIVLMSPKAYRGGHTVVLSDGKVGLIAAAQASRIIKKMKPADAE